jgi:hypothetical protein
LTRATGDCFLAVLRLADPRVRDFDALLRPAARMLLLRRAFAFFGRATAFDDFFLPVDFRAFLAMTPSSQQSKRRNESKIQASTVEPALLQVGSIHTMNPTSHATG